MSDKKEHAPYFLITHHSSLTNMRAIPTLRISISGVRGVVGDSLTPTPLVRFAQAFGTFLGTGTIVIGRFKKVCGRRGRLKGARVGRILTGSRLP